MREKTPGQSERGRDFSEDRVEEVGGNKEVKGVTLNNQMGGEQVGVKHCSFRDKVLGGAAPPPPLGTLGDLIQMKLAKVEWQDRDCQLLRVQFKESVIQTLAAPWVDSLVIKPLGKQVSYTIMRQHLRSLWRLKGGYDVMGVGNGYFMVKFDLAEDREKVITGGPWMLQNNYIAVKRWTPDFNPSNACFGRTMLWVRLEGLNMMYFEESAMRTIMSSIGRPIKIDFTTKMMEQGNFARACVEVDLSKPVARRVWIQDHWHDVMYESLHLISKQCGCYGHIE